MQSSVSSCGYLDSLASEAIEERISVVVATAELLKYGSAQVHVYYSY